MRVRSALDSACICVGLKSTVEEKQERPVAVLPL